MELMRTLLAVLVTMTLVGMAASQGYMGTVSTGTGILSPLAVGKEGANPAEIGQLSLLANYTGTWSVDLSGILGGQLEMEMFQQEEVILGSGRLTGEGTSLNVTAAGSVGEKGMTVFVTPPGGDEVFRLQLSASGSSISGEYEAFMRGKKIEAGTVTGKLILSAPQEKEVTLIGGVSPPETRTYEEAVQSLGKGSSSSRINKSIYKSSSVQGDMQ